MNFNIEKNKINERKRLGTTKPTEERR